MQIEIIYLAASGMIFLDFVLEYINDQRSNFVLKKGPLIYPIKFFCKTRDGHSKSERMEIIELHPKRVLQDDITKKPPPIPQIMAFFP